MTFSFIQIHKFQKKKKIVISKMIKAVTKIKDSIILIFSPIKLSGLINYKSTLEGL
jgi:hypothetical protein